MFAGWFQDKGCSKALDPAGYDNRKPAVKIKMPSKDTTIYAKFVSKSEDKKMLGLSSATKKLAKTAANATVGTKFKLKLGINSCSLVTVTAKGLPKGLAIDKSSGVISGKPKKAGVFKATVTVKTAAGNKIEFKVKIVVRDGVQLWEGGPYWAETNIGADNPWDYGLYFWWGDTKGHSPSSAGEFSFNFDENNVYTYWKSVSELQRAGWLTSDGVLAPKHDAAHVHWGSGWRMPTYQELDDLLNKCDWTWTTQNGVNGCVVWGRGAYAANSIFLPAAGNGDGTSLDDAGSFGLYWSSVPDSDYINHAWYLLFTSSYHDTDGSGRRGGQPVRPVQGFTE